MSLMVRISFLFRHAILKISISGNRLFYNGVTARNYGVSGSFGTRLNRQIKTRPCIDEAHLLPKTFSTKDFLRDTFFFLSDANSGPRMSESYGYEIEKSRGRM